MAEGFDTNRFHSTIHEGFTCPICLGVLKDPMQCENNEHYFCSGCIKKHLEKTSHSCPVCQEKLTPETLRKAPRLIEDVVSRLKISCNHASRGCNAVVNLGALQAHVEVCGFMPVTCSNDGCNEVVSKRDANQHERELCPFKTTSCDDCGEKMPHNKYGTHGCVLRRDVDDVKKYVAEIKSTQDAMLKEMQRFTSSFEKLEQSYHTVSTVMKSMSTDIVVTGGVDPINDKALSSVEKFNLFDQTWTSLPELKIARFGHATVLFGHQILVCGGSQRFDSSQVLDSIEVFNLNDNIAEWKEFPVNLPIKVAGHKCVVSGNRLLIFGGTQDDEDENNLDTIYELLLVPPYSSKFLCHMMKKRVFHAVELFDGKVLIAGGYKVGTNVELYDIAKNECVEMPRLPSPLVGAATVRKGDSMLLIGGLSDEDKGGNKIIEYDFKTGKSKVELVMKTERAGCVAFYHGNTLVIGGGGEDIKEEIDLHSVECFKFSSRSWKKLSPLIKGRTFASGVIVKKDNFEF